MDTAVKLGEDGEWYSWEEFEDFYGAAAAAEWERSPPRGHEWVAIFHCAKSTEQECIDRRLLGGPTNMRKALATPGRSICEGTALLLFNFQTREVHAPFRAAGPPGNLEAQAWGGRFPWQVRTVGNATRWPARAGGVRLAAMLKKNGTWISSHLLPAEWFPRAGAPTAELPADDVATESDVFSDSLSPPPTELAPEVQEELSRLTTSQRQAVRQLMDMGDLTTESALRVCTAADFDVNRAANFVFPESPPAPLSPAPAPHTGVSYGDVNPFGPAPDEPTTTAQAITWQQQQQQFVTTAQAITWQQQQQFVGEVEECCRDCGRAGGGATDGGDGHWYCSACWAAMEQAPTRQTEQLGKKTATARPEDCPEVAKLRDYLVHKVIITNFQRMLLDGPEAAAASMSGARGSVGTNSGKGRSTSGCPKSGKAAHQTTASSGGAFAALTALSDDEESPDSGGEASPAVNALGAASTVGGKKSSCMLSRGSGTPHEALKSAAKLMSSYFFRDLAEDNVDSDAVTRRNVSAEAWRRAGDRHDPMIPCNESAWPNVRIAFGLLLERWWGVERHDPIVQASMERLLKWCREACHRLEEQASGRHNPNLLHPDWQDDESGVEMVRGDDDMVRLRHGRVEVKLDSHRLDVLHSLLCQHSPDHVAQINTRVYNSTLRYETLAKFDQGTQGSLPQRVFDILEQEFQVDHECFASPLNATLRSFNSVFPDVDRFFGSKGSFFDFWPDSGSYEANPPFDEGSVAATFSHVNAILRAAEEKARQQEDGSALPLLFITATPFVPSDPLCKPEDRFVLDQMTLNANEHAYTLGMRHRKSDEWVSSNDTIVCFVGNQAAAQAWPVTRRKLQLLRQAWAPNAASFANTPASLSAAVSASALSGVNTLASERPTREEAAGENTAAMKTATEPAEKTAALRKAAAAATELRDADIASAKQASTCSALGRNEDALQPQKRLPAICERVHPADHLDIAANMHTLGYAQFKLGHTHDAEQLLKRAMEIRLRALPPRHADTLATLQLLRALRCA